MTKLDLFADGRDGFEFYRIPGLVVTASGVVLAYAEARKRGAGITARSRFISAAAWMVA